jgi:lipopolysaccharide export system permease protein
MALLDRYIARHVIAAMALVLLVLGGLDYLFTVVDELGGTNENYSTADAFRYVSLTFPRHLYELLPITALIGSLAGLGMMAAANELVVMQSSGVTIGHIVAAVMKPAFLVMVLGLVLGEYVAPRLELQAEVGKAIAKGQEPGLSRFGHWEREGDAFLHFNGLEPEGVLHGVSILVFDAQRRIVKSVQAERAVFMQLGNQTDTSREMQGSWVLENGSEHRFVHDHPESSGAEKFQEDFQQRQWDMNLTPDILKVLIIDPGKMAISDLYNYAVRFERQGQNADIYYLSFWKKILQPLTTAMLVLVAISFIFGSLRESTMGSRVFTAICFGLVFTLLQRLFHNLGLVFQFSPLLAVLVPMVVTALFGLLLFRRAA